MRCEAGDDVIPEEDENEIWNRPCREWADCQKVYLGWYTAPAEWFVPRFDTLKKRTPWLKLVRCRTCSTLWYVAVDTRDDDYYFLRLADWEVPLVKEDIWPAVFDNYDRFWDDGLMRRVGLRGVAEMFFPPPRRVSGKRRPTV